MKNKIFLKKLLHIPLFPFFSFLFFHLVQQLDFSPHTKTQAYTHLQVLKKWIPPLVWSYQTRTRGMMTEKGWWKMNIRTTHTHPHHIFQHTNRELPIPDVHENPPCEQMWLQKALSVYERVLAWVLMCMWARVTGNFSLCKGFKEAVC